MVSVRTEIASGTHNSTDVCQLWPLWTDRLVACSVGWHRKTRTEVQSEVQNPWQIQARSRPCPRQSCLPTGPHDWELEEEWQRRMGGPGLVTAIHLLYLMFSPPPPSPPLLGNEMKWNLWNLIRSIRTCHFEKSHRHRQIGLHKSSP